MKGNENRKLCSHCGGSLSSDVLDRQWMLWTCDDCARGGLSKHIRASKEMNRRGAVIRGETIVCYYGDVFGAHWTKESKDLWIEHRELPNGVLTSLSRHR